MNSPKTYALLILALTTLGGAGLAWQQYQELVELRAAALNKDERSDLQKRLADLEKRNKELQDELAAAQDDSGDNSGDMTATAGGQSGAGGNQNGRPGRGGRGGANAQQQAAFRALMATPEVQALMAVQAKARLEATYGALFKNLNLSSEQVDKVTGLLAERQSTMQDVFAAARDQGINPRTDPAAFQKLVAAAQAPINDGLKTALGDAGYSQLQNYDQTMPERNVVNQLQQRLAASDTPLTSAQSEQLVQILAANAPQRTNAGGTAGATGSANATQGQFGGGFGGGGPGGGGGFIGRGGGGGAGATVAVTPAAVSQAQSVLAANQLTALQQIQQQQAAQQQLQQILSAARNNGNTGGGNTSGSTTRRSGKGG